MGARTGLSYVAWYGFIWDSVLVSVSEMGPRFGSCNGFSSFFFVSGFWFRFDFVSVSFRFLIRFGFVLRFHFGFGAVSLLLQFRFRTGYDSVSTRSVSFRFWFRLRLVSVRIGFVSNSVPFRFGSPFRFDFGSLSAPILGFGFAFRFFFIVVSVLFRSVELKVSFVCTAVQQSYLYLNLYFYICCFVFVF